MCGFIYDSATLTYLSLLNSGVLVDWRAINDAGDVVGFWNTVVPLPTAFPLFATGLGVLGLPGWRRKRRADV